MSELDSRTQSASAADVELFDFYVAQLEAYLDGELNQQEAVEVRQRLMQEEAYAAALGRLHAQRVQRVEIFQQIERKEVDDRAASRVAASARSIAFQERTGRIWPMWTKVAFGMAACLLVGFGAGWVGDLNTGRQPAIPAPTAYGPETSPAAGRNTWILYDENGEPILELPAQNRPLRDLMHIPDRTQQQPPK